MARPKSFLKSMRVDRARRTHGCQHNRNHRISQGDVRLKLSMARSYEHFCRECARVFLRRDIETLAALIAELEGE